MAGPASSADKFFGAQGSATAPSAENDQSSLPSATQFFGLEQPQSGSVADTIWSSATDAGAHILKSMGYGAAEGWGAQPLELAKETDGWLRKVGIFNDYQNGHTSMVKSFNEAFLRPVIDATTTAGEIVQRGLSSGIMGAAGGLRELSEEIQGNRQVKTEYGTTQELGRPGIIREGLAAAPGMAAEYLSGLTEGYLPEFGEAPSLSEAAGYISRSVRSARASKGMLDASTARSAGVVGEGEAGFYDAVPLSPENIEARTNAAYETGMEAAPQTAAPPVDLHELARRVDPETFSQYDAATAERAAAHEEWQNLAAAREASPEAVAARSELNDLIGLEPDVPALSGQFEERLRAIAASAPPDVLEKVANAYGRLDDALSLPTDEMRAAQERMMAADAAMRDLAPQVSDAYRHAEDMTPEPLPIQVPQVAEAEAKQIGAQEARTEEQASTEPAQKTVIPAAVKEGQTAVPEAPNVLGEETLGGPENPEAKTKPRATNGPLKEIEGTGELKTRGLAQGVEAKAIEEGLTQNFGDLPEYRQVSMSEQADAAADLIAKDYDRAKAVAMGQRAAPKGLLPESVFVAVEKHALANGDVETLRELGTASKLSTSATVMGQRIRTLGERDKASPVGAIAEVQNAREAALKARNVDIEAEKTKAAQEIKTEMRRSATVKHDAWADFMAAIKCES